MIISTQPSSALPFAKLVNRYCLVSPLKKGKTTLQRLLLRTLLQNGEMLVESDRGFRFILKFPEDTGWECIAFYDTFEEGTVRTLEKIVDKGWTVYDVGANLGWYSLLLAKLVGSSGRVHAFEPTPPTFEKLSKHILLNGVDNTVLNWLALSAEEGVVRINTFEGLPHGHNSLSTFGRSDAKSYDVESIKLDSYWERQGFHHVDLIKMDVEGAEMLVLSGASRFIGGDSGPIWVIEMNQETAKDFGYSTGDIIDLFNSYGDYAYWRIVDGWGETIKIEDGKDHRHGDNVIVVPRSKADYMSQKLNGR